MDKGGRALVEAISCSRALYPWGHTRMRGPTRSLLFARKNGIERIDSF